jgi:chemotaxis response regulator CheB
MPKRLLLIDDSAKWTKMVARMAPRGFVAEQCNDPMGALDAFIEFKPDVVMLDMCMPEKDGIDVLNEILLTGIPAKVVLTSGYGSSILGVAEGVAKFHDNPNVATLGKPFRAAELAEVLNRLAP